MSEDKGVKRMSPAAIAVVGLAIVVLTGLAVLFSFSKVLRLETTVVSSGVTLPANGSTDVYGTTGQFPFLQDLSGCINSSTGTVLNAANFSITEGTVDGGRIALAAGAGEFSGANINCTTTTYLADTTSQSAADAFITGLTIFATFMAVIVLALVGKIIVGLFKTKK